MCYIVTVFYHLRRDDFKYMKKAIITLLILALLGGGGYGVYYYFFADTADQQSRVSSSSDDAVYVMTVSAITGYGTGSGVLERYSGEVEAQATIEVKLESDRTVDECYVEEGDIVEEGQALFSYETQEIEDDIAQAEIDIERDQMEIESNEAQITQNEKLMESATDSDEKTEYYLEILQLQNSNKSLEYEIKSKNLEIASLQETLDESVVTAEMGGIIQKISDVDDSSDSYSSSESAYITILAEGDYRIKGTVNELNYDDIYEGMPVIVYSRVDSSITWTGVISEISTEQDGSDSDDYYSYYYESSDTSTYSFYVDLDSSEGLLLGQHVYMEEDAGQMEEKSGLWLSEYYIMQEDGSAYVWLANTSNVIEKHEVTLGDYDEDLEEYEILDGLEADDYIAPLADTISEGDPVYYYDIAVTSDDDEYYDADEDDDDIDGTIYYDLDDEEYYDLDDDDDAYYYDDDDDIYYDDDDDIYYEDDDIYYDDDDDIYYDDDDDIYYDDDDDIYYDDDDDIYYDDDEDGIIYYEED